MLLNQLPGVSDVCPLHAQPRQYSINSAFEPRRWLVTKYAATHRQAETAHRRSHTCCRAASVVDDAKAHAKTTRGIRNNATELVGNTPMVNGRHRARCSPLATDVFTDDKCRCF